MIKTGLRTFDEKAGGIERSILTVIGAPTGEGKSLFKKCLQESAAKAGLKCLDLSFEDPPARSADRTLSTLTGINNEFLGQGKFDDHDLERIAFALENVEWADLIDYRYGLRSPDECLEIIADSDADLVQVDYAQAFPEGEKGLTKVIGDFSWDLNVDAQKKRRATIIYSQLKGRVEEAGKERAEASIRFGKGGEIDIGGFRPFGVGDLAWSQELGIHAKGLGFLFRPGRYYQRYGVNVPDNRMELIWPKRNFGKEGRIVVGVDFTTAALFDLNEETNG